MTAPRGTASSRRARQRLTPVNTLAKILWVRDHEPAVYRKTRVVLLPKDWLRLRLSGSTGTDLTDASVTAALDLKEKRWSSEVLAAVGVREDLFPPLSPSTEVVGAVTEEAAASTGLPAAFRSAPAAATCPASPWAAEWSVPGSSPSGSAPRPTPRLTPGPGDRLRACHRGAVADVPPRRPRPCLARVLLHRGREPALAHRDPRRRLRGVARRGGTSRSRQWGTGLRPLAGGPGHAGSRPGRPGGLPGAGPAPRARAHGTRRHGGCGLRSPRVPGVLPLRRAAGSRDPHRRRRPALRPVEADRG